VSALRVALDGRPLQSDPLGGVGRYLQGLLPHLAGQVDPVVLVDARRPPPRAGLGGGVELVELRAPSRVPGLVWLELAVAPWLRSFDGVFHGTFNVLPLTFRGPAVVTVHDLAPQLHPEDFRPGPRMAWRVNMRASVARARRITTVSEFVKGQIIEHFAVAPERVLVAPDALDPVFTPDRAAQARALARTLGIPTPYVVALGGAPRRGLPVAIDAWRRANRTLEGNSGRSAPVPVALVVVGSVDVAAEPGLVPVGRLEDESWATLLAGAQALCYPTRYEGFGLPALEAAASGTPVVCAPVASLPEVLGDAGCWASAPTAAEIAPVLARVLSDPDWHRARREAGLQLAARAPSWEHAAAVLVDAYRHAVNSAT
jgi:glycosyltransferase involved in cell wall biosynthesis